MCLALFGITATINTAQAPNNGDEVATTQTQVAEEKPIITEGLSTEELKQVLNLIAIKYGYEDHYPKMLAICNAESTLREWVDSYAGWWAGAGLCGFIPGTWNYVLDLMETKSFPLPKYCRVRFTGYNKEHPVYSAECNWIMALYLLNAEGDHHWDSSRENWSKIIN